MRTWRGKESATGSGLDADLVRIISACRSTVRWPQLDHLQQYIELLMSDKQICVGRPPSTQVVNTGANEKNVKVRSLKSTFTPTGKETVHTVHVRINWFTYLYFVLVSILFARSSSSLGIKKNSDLLGLGILIRKLFKLYLYGLSTP